MVLGAPMVAWLLATASGVSTEPRAVHDPAAVDARAGVAQTADLRNPFVLGTRRAATREFVADLKDPFVRPATPSHAPMQLSADLRDPFAAPTAAPPPAPTCTTSGGVPLQRPKAVREAAPPCPPVATNRT